VKKILLILFIFSLTLSSCSGLNLLGSLFGYETTKEINEGLSGMDIAMILIPIGIIIMIIIIYITPSGKHRKISQNLIKLKRSIRNNQKKYPEAIGEIWNDYEEK